MRRLILLAFVCALSAVGQSNVGARTYSGAQDLSAATVTLPTTNTARLGAITFTLDGGGSAITTGAKAWVQIPYGATILSHDFTCDQSGSIVLDLWKDTYANALPTVADTITASAKPTISATTKATDSTLTGWTTSITAKDIIRLNVDSASTVTACTLTIYVRKS